MRSPFASEPVFTLGIVPVTKPVLVTWAIMALLLFLSLLVRRGLSARPGKLQAVAELVQDALDHQIGEVLQRDPAPYRAFIGTIFIFILAANWSSLVPGTEPPTATLETDVALGLLALCSTVLFGIRANGVGGYLKTFARPSWVMIPLNIFEQITRSFSLIVRLFGNIMSGVFVIAIVLSLAGLFVPIPLMALDLLTGTVQAYIFAILACVFIAAGVSGDEDERPPSSRKGGSE